MSAYVGPYLSVGCPLIATDDIIINHLFLDLVKVVFFPFFIKNPQITNYSYVRASNLIK